MKNLTSHVHCELIKAWADGNEIQFFGKLSKEWHDATCPNWCIETVYRLKPVRREGMYGYRDDYLTIWEAEQDGGVMDLTANIDGLEDHSKLLDVYLTIRDVLNHVGTEYNVVWWDGEKEWSVQGWYDHQNEIISGENA